MARKALLVADLIKRLLELDYVDFGDGRLFFRDFVSSLSIRSIRRYRWVD